MAGILDLNRGVMHRFHPTGMRINMYIDDPGVYLSDTCEPVAAEIAHQAGYDTDKLKRQRIQAMKLAEFKAQLERETRIEEEAIAAAVSQTGKVDVRHVGGGQYAIFSQDGGKQMTKVLMSRADLELLGIKVPDGLDAATDPEPGRKVA